MVIHGHTKRNKMSSTYHSWHNMKDRCQNLNCPRYKDYGGRGISVCERWQNFVNFLEDMGECLEGLTLDRINNDGNYELNNCKWSTQKEQNNNCRPKFRGLAKQRWFYGYGPNGEMMIENNQHEVARIFGLIYSHISECLSGKLNIHHGFKFQRIG